MSLKDLFKKKKKEELKKEVKKEAKKPKKVEVKEDKKKEIKEVKKVEEKKPVPPKKKRESIIAPFVLDSPHIAEKSTELLEINQYVFKVSDKANKIEIKKAVEELYGVEVVSVRVINVHRKKRRVGRTQGWRAGYKKAIVKLKKGQEIDIMPR